MATSVTFEPTLLIGPLEIGVIIDVLLFGGLTIEVHKYFKAFPHDEHLVKCVVVFIWLCELGQTICVTHMLYVLTITFYGNPLGFLQPPKSLVVSILFSGVISPLVQSFFANRIHAVSKQWSIPVICWLLSILRFTASIVSFSLAINMANIVKFEANYRWLLASVFAIGVTVDVTITASLCWHLYKKRKQVVNDSIARKIDKLIGWTLQTGLPTSIMGLVEISTFLIMSKNSIWMGIFMFYSKLFSITLLASLNSRLNLHSLSGINPVNRVELTTVNDSRLGYNQSSAIYGPASVSSNFISTEITSDSRDKEES